MLNKGARINNRLKNAARAVSSALNKDTREAGADGDDDSKVPTTTELSSLTSKMDSDKTGKVDFGSFFAAMAAFMKPQYGREKLDKAFDEISGGLDEIDASFLHRTMVHLGQSTIRYADCEAMICEVDRNGHGRISKRDFHHLQTCTTDNI
ncbi:unnamed protein product [Ectocarpus sp. 4 AP-2014]